MPLTPGDIAIHYETRGASSGVPILFIHGYTAQLVAWQEGFCQEFVKRGAYVILFDNRDVGLSTKFGDDHTLDGGYSLADMANDGFGVLDALGLSSAHVVGASMGGMIAQLMALSNPSRVRSLNLIYTAPNLGQRYFPPQEMPDPVALARRVERAEFIEAFVKKEQISASTAYPFDEAWAREHGASAYDRCYAPAGVVRQAYALSRWTPTPEALAQLAIPTSIIHGRADQRIHYQAALDLEQLLKDAELHLYPGLGHEIPRELWPEFAATIMRTAARA